MNITKQLTNNYFWGHDNQPVSGIVLHRTNGLDNPYSTFLARMVSSHFAVFKDGSITQYVEITDSAWANGPMDSTNFAHNIPWLERCYQNQINPNYCTISIEHVGLETEELTEAQYQASLELIKYIAAQVNALPYGNLALDQNGVIVHNQITATECPGTLFPIQRFYDDLAPKPQVKEITELATNENDFILENDGSWYLFVDGTTDVGGVLTTIVFENKPTVPGVINFASPSTITVTWDSIGDGNFGPHNATILRGDGKPGNPIPVGGWSFIDVTGIKGRFKITPTSPLSRVSKREVTKQTS